MAITVNDECVIIDPPPISDTDGATLLSMLPTHIIITNREHVREAVSFQEEYKIIIAPGPDEISEAEKFNSLCILDNGKSLDINQLSSLIKNSSFVIANDTGPAHMAAHLGAKGLTLFGSHTTAYKVSIERENFKAIQVNDLAKLSTDKVLEKINLN